MPHTHAARCYKKQTVGFLLSLSLVRNALLKIERLRLALRGGAVRSACAHRCPESGGEGESETEEERAKNGVGFLSSPFVGGKKKKAEGGRKGKNEKREEERRPKIPHRHDRHVCSKVLMGCTVPYSPIFAAVWFWISPRAGQVYRGISQFSLRTAAMAWL